MTDKKKPADEKKVSGPSRHSKPTRKPVTIEAEANRRSTEDPEKEKKTSIGAAKSTTTKTEPSKGSVPKSTIPPSSVEKSDPGKASADAEAKPAPGFGRDGSGKPSKPAAAAPQTTKRDEKKQPEKRTGSGGLFLAALIGGGVALAGAAALQYAGLIRSPGATNRIAELEASIEAYRTRSQDRFAAIEETIAGLPRSESNTLSQEDIERLIEERFVVRPPNETSGLVERVATLEARLAESALAPGENGQFSASANEIREELDGLTERLVRLEQQPGVNLSDSPSSTDDQNIAALRQELDSRITEFQSRVENSLSSALDQARQATQQASNASSASNSVAAMAQSNTEALAALRQRLENGADRKAAAAIAAAALKNEIDSGRNFADALANLRSVAPDMNGLAELTTYAREGVPTVNMLKRRFDETVSDAIRDSVAKLRTGEETFADRLLSATQSLVTVKPIEALDGNTPTALLSQISASLDADDPAGAEAAWNKLPDVAKEVSAEWQRDLKARIVAYSIVAGALQSLLTIEQDG